MREDQKTPLELLEEDERRMHAFWRRLWLQAETKLKEYKRQEEE